MAMRQRVECHNFARFPLQIDEQIDPQSNQAIPAGIRTTIAHKSRGFALPLNFCRQTYRVGHVGIWISAEQTNRGSFGGVIEEFLSVKIPKIGATSVAQSTNSGFAAGKSWILAGIDS